MNAQLKLGRENKHLTTREVSDQLQIDQALISKFESGKRNPTHLQLIQLAELYELNVRELEVIWLKNKIEELISKYDFGPEALHAAVKEKSIPSDAITPEINAASIQKLMSDMEALKSMLSTKK